jgi:hypothetical protein
MNSHYLNLCRGIGGGGRGGEVREERDGEGRVGRGVVVGGIGGGLRRLFEFSRKGPKRFRVLKLHHLHTSC